MLQRKFTRDSGINNFLIANRKPSLVKWREENGRINSSENT